MSDVTESLRAGVISLTPFACAAPVAPLTSWLARPHSDPRKPCAGCSGAVWDGGVDSRASGGEGMREAGATGGGEEARRRC